MSDEEKQVEATAGPYKGQRLTLPAADADQAVADGWAIDPFAPVDPDAAPKEQTDEERVKSLEAAEKAMRKLRGEEDEKEEGGEPKKAKPTLERPTPVQRDMRPTDSPTQGYPTRQTPKRGE